MRLLFIAEFREDNDGDQGTTRVAFQAVGPFHGPELQNQFQFYNGGPSVKGFQTSTDKHCISDNQGSQHAVGDNCKVAET